MGWSPRPLTEAEVEWHAANIERDGYSIMEGAIPEPFRRELLDELDRLEEARPGGDVPPQAFTGLVTRRWLDLLNDGEVWQRVAIHPWLMRVLPRVLGEGFLLSTMATALVGAGEPEQAVHDDDSVYQFPRPHPNLVCNSMWALTDFTEQTGATRIVPGSNHWLQDPEVGRAYDTVPMLMPAGSICPFVGSLYHGAGHNRSGRDRIALTINYCSGSMRQQENLMLGIHPERMMTFPKALQDLLGFKMCKGAGHIFGQDPRLEMTRHFAAAELSDTYLDVRDDLHDERMATPRQRPVY
jgi:hypothetical protein